MRNLALTALLLLPVAAAQTVPAIPATPSTSTSAPVAPAPVAPVPVAPAPASPTDLVAPAAAPTPNAPVLLLTAPVGAGVELVMNQTTQMKVKDVQVTAAPGSKLSEAQLNDIRRSVSEALNKEMTAQTVPGKLFVKVTGREAGGQTTLLTSMIQNAKAKRPVTLKVTQLIGTDGKVTFKSIESDDPQLAGVLKALTPEKIQGYVSQNGTDVANVYGKPLIVGETRTVTSSLDAQELLQSLLAAVAGTAGQGGLGKISASPLEVTTAVTYKGQNAQNQLTFETLTQMGTWQISLNPKAGAGATDSMNMDIALQGATGKSTAVYRPDGLPVSQNTTMNMDMQMTMQMQGVQVRMTMSMQQTMTLKPR